TDPGLRGARPAGVALRSAHSGGSQGPYRSSRDLALPSLRRLLCRETPCYAWSPDEQQPWHPTPRGRLGWRASRCLRRARVEVGRYRRVVWVVCNFLKGWRGSTATSPTPFSGCGPVGPHHSPSSSTSDVVPGSLTK